MIFPSFSREMASSFNSRWMPPCSFMRQRTTRNAEIVCERTVAMATPATPRWQTMTKNRFSKTFTMPAPSR